MLLKSVLISLINKFGNKDAFVTIALVLFFTTVTNAQQNIITISGTVLTGNGEPLIGCNIRIQPLGRPMVIGYANTNHSNTYSVSLSAAQNDTLRVTCTSIGFIMQTIILPINNLKFYQANFKLSPDVQELNGVTVKAPSVWKRGDTTFYRVDAFKEGDEKKLIDVITKIPDFSISADGQLLYKNEPVDKILIEGEEIFTDKIQLLLKSVPAHVLNTIQALENQSDNKLLKGLSSDGKIFVNLGLKKNKLKTAFGDAEAGIGTGGRYTVNPTLFSIYGKLKFGFLANWNTTGNGLNYQDLNELKGMSLRKAEEPMMNTNLLQPISGFADSRYVRNRLQDNRLQINIPLSTKIKSQFEVNYIKDRQQQNSFINSAVYNNGSYFQQQTKNKNVFSPSIFTAKVKTIISVDSLAELNIAAMYERNTNKSSTDAFILQGPDNYETNNHISNLWNGLTITFDYLKRKSKTTAVRLRSEYSYYQLLQTGRGYSSSWPAIFDLPDPSYDLLIQQLKNTIQHAKAEYEYLWKKKKMISIKVTTEIDHADFRSPLSFASSNQLSTFPESGFSGQDISEIKKMYLGFDYGFKFLKQPMYLETKAGAYTSDQQTSIHKNTAHPLFEINVHQRRYFTPNIYGYGTFYAAQSPLSLYQASKEIFPSGIGQFYVHRNNTLFPKVASLSYGIVIGFNDFTRLNLYGSYLKSFTTKIFNPAYIGFVSLYTDSLIRKSTSSYFTDVNIIVPWLALKTRLTIGASLFAHDRLLLAQSLLQRQHFLQARFYLELKRNWNRTFFVTVNSNYTGNLNDVPVAFSGVKKTGDLSNSVNIRGKLSKLTEMKFSGECLLNNLFTLNKHAAFFADIEIRHSLPKQKLSISMKLENITNQKEYMSTSRFSELFQSFYRVPLISRNILLTFRYEL